MLYGDIVHPPLLGALAAAGHGSRVLLTDGNYPASTGTYPDADRVFLNFAPGLLTVSQILERLVATLPVEAATVMAPADGTPVDAHDDFRSILPAGTPFESIGRFEFYDKCREPDLAVVVATGDQRLYANLLLTVGVRTAD